MNNTEQYVLTTDDSSKIIKNTVLVAILAAAIISVVAGLLSWRSYQASKVDGEYLAEVTSGKLSKQLYNYADMTTILSVMIHSDPDIEESFPEIAQSLYISDDAITSLLIAKNGVVTDVYPANLKDSYNGLSLLSGADEAISSASIRAMQTRKPVISELVTLPTGEEGFFIVNAIYKTALDGVSEQFWGMSAVVLKSPQIYDSLDLERMQQEDYKYQMYGLVTEPEMSLEDIEELHEAEAVYLHGSTDTEEAMNDAVEYTFEVPGNIWRIELEQEAGWLPIHDSVARILVCVFILALIIAIAYFYFSMWEQRSIATYSATHDLLTGLRNRTALRDDFSKLSSDAKRVSVMLIDVDDFKEINDIHGHSAGDDCLMLLGELLEDTFEDDQCYRYGGDEFLVISGREDNDFSDLVNGFVQHYQEKVQEELDVKVGCSAGYVSGICANSNDLRQMIHQADMFLYEVKNKRKGMALGGAFDPDMENEENVSRRAMAAEAHTVRMDYVTMLMNRKTFERQAELSIRNANKGTDVSFIFFDIDAFRDYNAKYGFEQGDVLLYQVGLLLAHTFVGRCVSRFSDDHFVAMAYTDEVDSLLMKIKDTQYLENGEKRPGLFAGIYNYVQGGTVDLACDRAKFACDTAKEGRWSDWVYYSSEMEDARKREKYVLENLRNAIDYDWIDVYYHPIVRVLNGQLTEAEALCRWIDPNYGLLSPAVVIPVLEKSRRIEELDLHILRLVCKDMKALGDSEYQQVPISVNFSRVDLEDPELADKIETILNKYQVPKKMICIEILESAMSNVYEANVITGVQNLRARGFKIWIDDFGSGLSSLNSLKNLDFDMVKLDMDFLRDISENENNEAEISYLTTVIGMLKELHVQIIAEGVETSFHLKLLQSIGCQKAQGYHFDKPMSGEDFYRRWIKSNSRVEPLADRHYYDSVGTMNLLHPVLDMPNAKEYPNANTLPAVIVEITYDEYLKIIEANDAYLLHVRNVGGASLRDAEWRINLEGNGFHRRLLETLPSARHNPDQWYMMDSEAINGDYCMVHMKYISSNSERNKEAVICVMLNLSQSTEARKISRV